MSLHESASNEGTNTNKFVGVDVWAGLLLLCAERALEQEPWHVEDVEDYIIQQYIESTHYIGSHVEGIKGVKYYE